MKNASRPGISLHASNMIHLFRSVSSSGDDSTKQPLNTIHLSLQFTSSAACRTGIL
jgi:hypothetical protein